jgi:prepilin-type N-terminal cleavage/methylation domain-containing protein
MRTRDTAQFGQGARATRAFTLAEMLVVLVIIAILAALALPNIRGNLESRAIDGASRQLLADLAFARQKAISQRSIVAVVFVPGDVLGINLNSSIYDNQEREAIKQLQGGAYTQYALYGFRRAGEQPGQGTEGYLTEWKTLPEKTFFGTNQFLIGAIPQYKFFRFPFSRSMDETLPYIAFDAEGRLVTLSDDGSKSVLPGDDISIEVARGAILYARDNNGVVTGFDLQEIPPFNSTNNIIHIDALTGRAEWIKPQLP